ncbi:hypothetical protein CDAR_426611 [Caerostris darwini]|uniref:Uncharacterized protein n=1 Tax=Caerostris darwini TaxID=1538125 RepID=A0AAV4N915_9ARAC|nr:hypothetical protein CDAR_426611 [Caerostris darwini]
MAHEESLRLSSGQFFSQDQKKEKEVKKESNFDFCQTIFLSAKLDTCQTFPDLNPIPMNLPESIFEDEHPVAVILSPWARENGILKLLSGGVLGDRNRTSAYLRDWCNVQRLKRNSPFSMVASAHLLESNVEQHILVHCVDPSDGLPNLHFHTELSVQVNT